jgi:hypothetical protein
VASLRRVLPPLRGSVQVGDRALRRQQAGRRAPGRQAGRAPSEWRSVILQEPDACASARRQWPPSHHLCGGSSTGPSSPQCQRGNLKTLEKLMHVHQASSDPRASRCTCFSRWCTPRDDSGDRAVERARPDAAARAPRAPGWVPRRIDPLPAGGTEGRPEVSVSAGGGHERTRRRTAVHRRESEQESRRRPEAERGQAWQGAPHSGARHPRLAA